MQVGSNGTRGARQAGVVTAAAFAILLSLPAVAGAAPGSPGIPGPPAVIFEEDFENVPDPPEPGPPVVNGTYQFISDYTGAGPLAMTYTAAPSWISVGQCNGLVLSFNTNNPAGSCGAGGFNALRGLAQALGGFDPPPNGANFNHALSAWTLNQSVATTPAATLETESGIPLSSANRFITFSVDVGVTSCGAPFDPLLRFFLIDGSDEIQVTDSAIDVCADPRGDPPPGAATRTGSYASDGSILTSASSVGFKLTNDQGESNGNDYAYDNVRMLDATPQLDKEFVPGAISLGGTTTLRFTITNTDDLAAKEGWSFTDTLASGLKVASEDVETDCPNATVELELDGDVIGVEGDLDADMESCTVEVEVMATAVGTHENSEGNVSDLVGLDPPGEAELTCDEPPDPPTDDMVGVFVDCDFSDEPPANDFTIQQDWESEANTISYQTPVVGDLFGTGDPAIVVGGNRSATGGSPQTGRLARDLHVYDGATGDVEHTITTPRYSWTGHAAAAIADLDEDGRGEIIFRAASFGQAQADADAAGVPAPADIEGRLVAYEYDPSGDDWNVMWVSDHRYDHGPATATVRRSAFSVSLADFNGDDVPEVYAGNQIFNARTGVRLAAGDVSDPSGCQAASPSDNLGCYAGQAVAADLDGDGDLELAAGSAYYDVEIANPNGEVGNSITIAERADPTNTNVGDGYTAVADMDLDGAPEIVVMRVSAAVATTVLYVWDPQTGAVEGLLTGSQMTGANGSVGGPPMIGDIDGDGRPEVVVVTTSRLRAFDFVPGTGLQNLWTVNTNDGSGGTSMSMFDFNSDGEQEIVYRDETQLRIIDGGPTPLNTTNRNLATFACSSGTGAEMPVVADIGGSGEARILITCANPSSTVASIRAYETASFAWANTRPVWNQQAYFVTHINDDLTVPSEQFPNWTVFDDPDHLCSDGANRPLNNFQVQITDLDSETGCPVVCVPPSLEVDKTSDPPTGTTVMPGETITYSIAIENTSSDDVPDMNLTDDLSDVLDDAEITSGPTVDPPGAGTATITGDELSFNGTIPEGGTVTIIYEATVKPRGELGDRMLGNSVIGEFSNCDGITGRLRCTTEHPVAVRQTDLELEKTGDAVVDPGDPLSYTLTVTNHGPDDSAGATVSDTLPPGLTNIVVPEGCELAGFVVTCEVGPLAVDASTEIEITADAPDTPATCFENDAAVEADGDDLTPANDEASFRTCTTPVADLVLTKETNPAVVDPGQQFTYFLTVTNNGPNTSSGSTITDTLPDGVTIVAFPEDDCDVAGQTITCDVGPLTTTEALGYLILVEAPDTPSTCFENTAAVEGDDADPAEGDPDLLNNGDTARTCTTPAADLEIAKSGPAEVDAGGEVTWTLTVTNNGPQASTGSTVTDTIPDGITDIEVPAGCELAGQTLTCEAGALGVDESTEIEITGTAPATGSTCFENQASVEGTEGDPDLLNNESETVETCTRLADLELEKSADEVIDPGAEVTWTVTVTNNGPDASHDATVTDTLPDGITNIVVPANCDLVGLTVTCDVGPLLSGDSTEIVITGDAPDTPATCFENAAVVEDSSDPDASDDEASVRTCTTPAADLELLKTAPADVDPGGQVTWTLTVTNHGPQASSGSTVTDTIPDGITDIEVPANCELAGQTVTCEVGPLGPDGSAEIVVTGNAPNDANACFTNDASVGIDDAAPDEGDPDPSNNEASVETCTNEGANLDIAKIADAGPHFAGDSVTYTLTVTNLGPATAHDVTVTDDLPGSLTLVSATPSQGTCNDADPVQCGLGTIGLDEAVEIAIVATIGEDQSGEEIENTACVAGSVPDPADGNDCATEPIAVEPEADLAISKTVDPEGPVQLGETVTYTLTVANLGPNDATSVSVTDEFTDGDAEVLEVTPSQGTCEGDGPITCDLLTIANGAEATIVIVARPLRKGELANHATVTSEVADPDPDNNEDDATTKALAPSLDLKKRASKAKVRPGQVLAYRITVRNRGDGVATNVRVCDRVPAGLKVLRAPKAKTRTKRRVCWLVDSLAAGAKRTFRLVAQVKPSVKPGKRLRNVAVAAGAGGEKAKGGDTVAVKPAGSACPGFARC